MVDILQTNHFLFYEIMKRGFIWTILFIKVLLFNFLNFINLYSMPYREINFDKLFSPKKNKIKLMSSKVRREKFSLLIGNSPKTIFA